MELTSVCPLLLSVHVVLADVGDKVGVLLVHAVKTIAAAAGAVNVTLTAAVEVLLAASLRSLSMIR